VIDQQHLRTGVDEPLGVRDEILDLAIAERALVAWISTEHHEPDGALGSDLGEANRLSLNGRQGKVGRLVAHQGVAATSDEATAVIAIRSTA